MVVREPLTAGVSAWRREMDKKSHHGEKGMRGKDFRSGQTSRQVCRSTIADHTASLPSSFPGPFGIFNLL